MLKEIRVYENDKEIESDRIEYYDSNILQDAKHIIFFIDEVTRNEEAKEKQKPVMNWIHKFSSFEDVIKVLKSELGVDSNL
jgi:negative regulator of genetic competence, sporulation and motility